MPDDRRRCPTRRARRLCRGLSVAVALLLLSGCAGWSSFGKSSVPDVKPIKDKRGREAARLIREQRDRGELEAARFAWEQGDLAGAQELLERVLKRDPKHCEAGLLMAELLIVQQQPDDARRQLAQLVASHPRDPRALHAMGALLEAEDKPQEALAYFQRAARLAPDNHEYRISCQSVGGRSPPRVAVRTKTGGTQPKETQPTDTAPKGTQTMHGPSEASVANARRTDAEFAVAADHEETPLPAVLNVNAATLVSERNERVTTGSVDNEAAEAPPPEVRPGAESTEAEKLLEYGDAALAAGARRDARGYFRRARRASPKDAKIPVSAALLAIKRDELELAIEIAQDGLKAFPGSSGLYRLLGVAQYRLGDMHAAKASFEQSLSLDKSNPLSYFLMGSTLKKLGQTEAAEQHFLQARRLDPRYAARR